MTKLAKGQIHPLAAEFMEKLGLKQCQLCSLPNWKIFHNHGQLCPKADTQSAADSPSTKEKS